VPIGGADHGYRRDVELIPEVRAAAAQLAALSDETLDLVDTLERMAALVVPLLPTCIGLSMTVIVDAEPYTITATAAELRELDLVQYVADGPCVEASRSGEEVPVRDALDETRWQEFAQAAAARGVRSSLSIPLLGPDGRPWGAVNLYASEPDAFQGSDVLIARLLGSRVEGAVANADLSFATLDRARQLPQQLADHASLEQAVGVLIARRGITAPEARERIEFAARRAGVPLRAAAEVVIELGTG
jgi:GAF domain-containing protein